MASDHLPQDKESVYWLNLQDIPPALGGSGIAIALRTKLKLFIVLKPCWKAVKGRKKASACGLSQAVKQYWSIPRHTSMPSAACRISRVRRWM